MAEFIAECTMGLMAGSSLILLVWYLIQSRKRHVQERANRAMREYVRRGCK